MDCPHDVQRTIQPWFPTLTSSTASQGSGASPGHLTWAPFVRLSHHSLYPKHTYINREGDLAREYEMVNRMPPLIQPTPAGRHSSVAARGTNNW